MGIFFKKLGESFVGIVFSISVKVDIYLEIKMMNIITFFRKCLWVGTMLAGGCFQAQEGFRDIWVDASIYGVEHRGGHTSLLPPFYYFTIPSNLFHTRTIANVSSLQ